MMPLHIPAFAPSLPLPSLGPPTARLCLCPRPRMTAATSTTHTLNGRSITGPLQPISHNILVKVAEPPSTTTGGLLLSSTAKEKPTYGEAVEVGPGKRLGNGVEVPMTIAKGDFVLYGKYGGTDLEYDEQKHTVVTQDDVLCKLRDGLYEPDAVQPVYDRVLIKIEAPSQETSGGILVTRSNDQRNTVGKVVAMGPGRFMENGEMEPLSFQVGDTVFYGQYAGTDIEFRGEKYVIVRVADVYAKY